MYCILYSLAFHTNISESSLVSRVEKLNDVRGKEDIILYINTPTIRCIGCDNKHIKHSYML